MTNMQRWTWGADVGKVGPKAALYVTYADHVAAMIAEGGAAKNYAYEQGQRDALARLDAYLAGCNCPHVDGARAAIRGDQP